MKDTGASLVVPGVSQDASAVDVTLTDGVTSSPPVVAATTDTSSGPQNVAAVHPDSWTGCRTAR